MKYFILFLVSMVFLNSNLFAQKDTVNVPGFFESGGKSPDNYGTLNAAVDLARSNGTINNTVFKLTPYDIYVMTKSLFLDIGENLDIVAPKPLRAGDADPTTVQNSAPPQIVWDESVTTTADDYIIQTYGNLTMKNIWVRYADFVGTQRSCSITFIDTVAQGSEPDKEHGSFEGCLFDYCPIGSESAGAITVDADHFTGKFEDCYFRNLTDNHFRYYGRAVSFPYQSSGYHNDTLIFENCSFSNLSRIIMQEGNEYTSNVYINHCTLLNSVEWVYQSAGWLEHTAITNSIFVNPYMFGYRALDVCDTLQTYQDFLDGKCNSPGGGLINGITAVDSFGFVVPFTDYQRQLYIGNNAYMYQDWMVAWYTDCPLCKEKHKSRLDKELYNPAPMIGETAQAFIDSMDTDGKKVFPNLNVDWATIYTDDPDFKVAATNEDTLKLFMEGKWGAGTDIDWSYQPNAGFRQQWPLPEDLAYNNTAYQTAAMGGYPLGDLNWYPTQKAAWQGQKDDEWNHINELLSGTSSVVEIPGATPKNYILKQNYPNPFNPSTTIEYSIPFTGHVSLTVFNALGQEIVTLYNGVQKAGSYKVPFNGAGLSSGVYIYRLKAKDVTLTRKFVLMK